MLSSNQHSFHILLMIPMHTMFEGDIKDSVCGLDICELVIIQLHKLVEKLLTILCN